MGAIPTLFAQPGWYSIPYIARRLGLNVRTVQYWAQNGLFTRMGIKVISIPAKGWSGRALTWVWVPNVSKYARLRNLAIDKLPESHVPSV